MVIHVVDATYNESNFLNGGKLDKTYAEIKEAIANGEYVSLVETVPPPIEGVEWVKTYRVDELTKVPNSGYMVTFSYFAQDDSGNVSVSFISQSETGELVFGIL